MKIEHAKLVRAPESLLPLADALMARTCKSEALLEVLQDRLPGLANQCKCGLGEGAKVTSEVCYQKFN